MACANEWASSVRRSVRNDRRGLDLDFCAVFEQTAYFDSGHRREMTPDDFAINRAEPAVRIAIFALVDQVPGHPNEVLGTRARFGEHGDDVRKRLARLRHQVGGLELLRRIPADLARDKHQLTTSRNAVRIALGRRPVRRLQYLHDEATFACADWHSLKRCSLPVSVRGSDGTYSIARGYLYGAIVCLTKSCSPRVVASSAVYPGLSTTYALTICPRCSSEAATTPHSATAGCSSNAPSTSGPAML